MNDEGVDIREYSSPKGLAIRIVNSYMVQASRVPCSDGANTFIDYMNCCAYIRVFSLSHFFLLVIGTYW